jgi:hypothetical protein
MNATHGDPGIVLGWDWSTGDHPLNSPATIDVCLAPHLGDVVVVTADARVAKISPRRFTLPESSNGVVPFRVTAIATGTAYLTLRLHEGKTRATMPGPTIVAAHTDWHLYCATADKSYCG